MTTRARGTAAQVLQERDTVAPSLAEASRTNPRSALRQSVGSFAAAIKPGATCVVSLSRDPNGVGTWFLDRVAAAGMPEGQLVPYITAVESGVPLLVGRDARWSTPERRYRAIAMYSPDISGRRLRVADLWERHARTHWRTMRLARQAIREFVEPPL